MPNTATLKAAPLNTVAPAAKLGAQLATEIHVLVAGADCSADSAEAAKVAGVTKVLVADAAH